MWAGNVLLPLRWILGWTYFSAFWRRLVLENKLVMDEPGYIGEKFNHFLPNAFLIQGPIEFFLLRPEWLWWKLLAFTIFEGLVGLALLLGWMTRGAGLAVAGLAGGILLGAGWLGTTCLDEWQIGLLGIGGGLAIFFAGGGSVSLDAVGYRRGIQPPTCLRWTNEPGFSTPRWIRKMVVPGAIALALLGLLTNQVFHGGVYGTLHNKSVKPMVEISSARVEDGTLTAQIYRVEGADVYGSFTIAARVVDAEGGTVVEWDAAALAAMDTEQFRNHYIAKVRPGKNSLVLPLGAKADVSFHSELLKSLPPGKYWLELEDISGVSWSEPLTLSRS
ncbi:MAG: quinol oxidase [Verrucomicrobiaceae bacterium]|nr:quinol oxidase [Verrucomicrobiaceae bacterium]